MRPSPWPVLLPPFCPCCLPGRPLPPAAAGLRLLSPSSSLFALRLSPPASQPVCGFVCCLLSFFGIFFVVFWFVFCLVFLVRSSGCVVVFVCCAWCQLTEVTKDCRGPPAPTSHTHTRHRDFLPPLAYLLEVGLSLNSFVLLFVLAVLLPCPSGTSVLFCKGSRI